MPTEYHVNTYFGPCPEAEVLNSFAEQGWYLVTVTTTRLPMRMEGETLFPAQIMTKHYFERNKVEHNSV